MNLNNGLKERKPLFITKKTKPRYSGGILMFVKYKFELIIGLLLKHLYLQELIVELMETAKSNLNKIQKTHAQLN